MKELSTEILTSWKCLLCPHECRAERMSGQAGICGAADETSVASVCIHKGEEPVISGMKGVCNVFFSRCNMQCIYCQNFQISSVEGDLAKEEVNFGSTIDAITDILKTGVRAVGFVSPSHRINTMLAIIDEIRKRSFSPAIIYNTNGYDRPEVLRTLDDHVDVYLADFKYADDTLAFEMSGVKNYTEIALAALQEMVRQKGTALFLNDENEIERGVIVRHLVLPGYIENSKKVIDILSDNFSSNLHISLMSQYNPTASVANHATLGRRLHPEEYEEIAEYLEYKGFYKGWVQEFESSRHYNPDFRKEHPFES